MILFNRYIVSIRILFSNILFLLFVISGTHASVTEKGYFLSIRNFTPKDYKARPQNWAITEDNRGVLYFGNNKGILVYDGIYWKTIGVPGDIVYSLDSDSNGIIYVGGNGNFGYINTTTAGRQEFVSLLGYLHDKGQIVDAVWQTHATPEGAYFLTGGALFKWTGDTMFTWPASNNFHASFYVNGDLYVDETDRGLLKMKGDSLVLIKGGEKFAEIAINGMIPSNENGILIFTEREGIFHMKMAHSTEAIKLVRHFNEIDNFLFDNAITCAIRINDKQFAVGSQGRGVIVYDQSSDQFDILNFTTGLQDEVIYNMHTDRRGYLWMALSNGISMSPVLTSVTTFGYNSGIKETVEGIGRFGGKLFVANLLGTYYMDNYMTAIEQPNNLDNPLYKRPGFRKIEGINEQCYAIRLFQNQDEKFILVATYSGVSQIDTDHRSKQILECYPWYIFQSESYPSRVIIANVDGVESIYRKRGCWIRENKVAGIEEECRSIAEDPKGCIWVGTVYSGSIYRIKFGKPGQGTAQEVTRYDSLNGLPAGEIYIERFGNRLLFGTEKGLYYYNETQNKFQPDSSFGLEFCNSSRNIIRISVDHDGYLWLVTYNNISEEYETGYLKLLPNASYKWIKEPFVVFSQGVIYSLYHDTDGVTWLGGPDGLFRYDRKIAQDYEFDYYALLRNITIKGDSQLFAGTFTDEKGFPALSQNPDLIPRITYRYNDIAFEFSAPTNEDGTPVLFSHYLEGFENGWHDWSPESRREYTNLRERTYTFYVKARNLYEHESATASYTFTILPPWYRTFPALAGFILLGIGIVWTIVVLYTRGLRAIIRERTAEIRKQKELIEEKNQDIMDSINYAKRIQAALLPPGDYIDSLLPERFILYMPRDVVSGDYYWMIGKDGKIICVTADCTGHGVPGAMMSMMGMSYLNEITSRDQQMHSDEIMNQLRSRIVKSLRQKGVQGESQDGMDMALYIIEKEMKLLEFSGANLPLYLFRNGELKIFEPDKMPIGISSKLDTPFTRNKIQLESGDVLYTFSDGYQDQFGGPKNKKFMIKNLRQLLCDIHTKSMSQQRELLKKSLTDWMHESDCTQVDDITVVGVKI